ncbi:17057_t:CDS:2, partial [Funneliformis geosporum]
MNDAMVLVAGPPELTLITYFTDIKMVRTLKFRHMPRSIRRYTHYNTAKLNEYTKTTKTDKLPNLTFVAVGMSVGFGTLTVINSIVDRSVGPIYTKLNEQNTSIKEKFDEQNASIKGKFDEQNALIKK